MKFMLLMLPTVPGTLEDRRRLRPIGRNNERYQQMPAWDPIRAAEELAVLDHLTKGRVYAGFARGYQDRWVNVLGQQYHATGAPMDGSAIDNHNRRVYEETLKVIKKAWTEEAFDY